MYVTNVSKQIVDRLLRDLAGRKTDYEHWDQDVKDEMRKTWEEIVEGTCRHCGDWNPRGCMCWNDE